MFEYFCKKFRNSKKAKEILYAGIKHDDQIRITTIDGDAIYGIFDSVDGKNGILWYGKFFCSDCDYYGCRLSLERVKNISRLCPSDSDFNKNFLWLYKQKQQRQLL